MTEDLSTAQRLQMAAMTTDALSNLLDRSKHLCYGNDGPADPLKAHADLLRQTTQLTAATLAETIQALIPATKVEVAEPFKGDLSAHVGGTDS